MSFKDSKIAAAANSAMTLSAELAVDTEEYFKFRRKIWMAH